jgi:type II secretory pathway pseudopilin PulG
MKYIKGFGLIEIIIGAAIISGGILSIVTSFNIYTRYALSNQYNIQTAYLLEEGVEVIRFFRDNGWTTTITPLATTTPYYLVFNEGEMRWATTTNPYYIDGRFLRSVVISDVYRNAQDEITSSGVYDSQTKLITVSVSFVNRSATTTKTLSAYISNIYND